MRRPIVSHTEALVDASKQASMAPRVEKGTILVSRRTDKCNRVILSLTELDLPRHLPMLRLVGVLERGFEIKPMLEALLPLQLER